MARIVTLVGRVRAESRHTVPALAGDTISPPTLSAGLRGRQWIAAWNRLGLGAATFGNHEFDFGPATLVERMRESRFPWLSATVRDRATGRPFGGARSELILERGRARLGLFGPTLPEARDLEPGGRGAAPTTTWPGAATEALQRAGTVAPQADGRIERVP